MNPPGLAALSPALLASPMEQAPRTAPLLDLTTALARGDDAAWAQFHREFGPRIFRQLLAATRGDHDLASEALQQTYLRIARHARPCAEEPMFLTWLRVVARTALSDCRRRRQSFWAMLQRRRDEADENMEARDHAHESWLQAALDSALAQLDEPERALLAAKYFSGLDVRTVAAQLGVSEKAAESRLTRARAALREKLAALLATHE